MVYSLLNIYMKSNSEKLISTKIKQKRHKNDGAFYTTLRHSIEEALCTLWYLQSFLLHLLKSPSFKEMTRCVTL